MKKRNCLVVILSLILPLLVAAQEGTRYVDSIFASVQVERDVPYATNISVLTVNNGDPDTVELVMDIYSPVGDLEEQRPVVIYLHSGYLLPPFFNGLVTGSKLDSAVVEVCTRLAKRGYVAVAPSYRLGWSPLAASLEVNKQTFLQALYRGIHDTHSSIRFLRKTVIEDSNPYHIDPDKIALWGERVGGSIALGVAYLDDYSEVTSDSKFFNGDTAEPYLLLDRDGDVFGLQPALLHIPNWQEYTSEVDFIFNQGGFLMDTSWINHDSPFQPPVASIHSISDPFFPFGAGPQWQTWAPPNFLSWVIHGSRTVHEKANSVGINQGLDMSAWQAVPGAEEINMTIEALSDVPLDLITLGQSPTTYASPHLYPLLSDNIAMSSPWSWWGKPQLDSVVMEANEIYGTDFDSDILHEYSQLTYAPNMSAEHARAYIDTTMMVFLPRACQALQLEPCSIVNRNSEELVDAEETKLRLAPNPGNQFVLIDSDPMYPIKGIQIYDAMGRYLFARYQINSWQYRLERGALAAGTYFVQVLFEEGVSAQRVVFR
mgnify:CR=1 FL=1